MSNADVVRGLYEAFGRGDVPSVLGLLAPDVDWREARIAHMRPRVVDGTDLARS